MTVQELVRNLTKTARSGQLTSGQSEKLAEILADYLERLEHGESVNTSAIVAEHPELADELRENFSKLGALHRAAIGMTDGRETLDQMCLANLTELKTLGDFRLIRPIGRGGMGVVYEAEQISLARRVALKTLPLAAVLDPKQLARFKNEAQAAASLDHPHIVSVYAVGSDRGVHYYAMQFIEGLSLAEVVEHLRAGNKEQGPGSQVLGVGCQVSGHRRDDTTVAALSTLRTTRPIEYFRSVAHLGIQAAEALHYAHEMGLVHRDVKPSNLLLDNEGQLYVTDFGLAMTQTDSNLTMTGDLLGTLRYMSPEQASGRRALVDRRTDIYSLGASLYELVTLRPAFPEEDRTRLLQQIVSETPKLPSQIDRRVPKDLETIILKALAKEPTERYATAQDVADDLRRYFNDEPIQARRPSPAERAAKWSRRHRTLFASIVVMLLLSFVGLSVGALLIARQRNAAQAAAVEAKTQRTRAEENLRQARAAVDRMFKKIAEEFADGPHMEQLRRQLLEEMLQIYQGFLIANDDDPEIRYETALVHGRVAEIYGALGDFGNCLEQYESQHRIIFALHQRFPKSTRYRELLAQNFARLGEVLLRLNRLDSGPVHLDASRAQWERLAADYPTNPLYRQEIAAWYLRSSWIYHPATMADPAKAVRQMRQGLQMLDDLERDFPTYRIDSALREKGHRGLGFYLSRLWRCEEAEVHYRKSVELNINGNQTRLLAHLLLMRGALEEAEDLAQTSIHNYQRISDDHPDSMTPATELRKGFDLLAYILMASERWKEAEEAAKRRLQIDAKLCDRFPDDAIYRHGFAWSTYELGTVRFGAGKYQEAADDLRQAITHFEALAEQFPNVPRYHNALAYVLSTCPAKELRIPDRAVNHAHRALELSPDNPDFWVVLAAAQYVAEDYGAVLASTEEARKRFDDRLPSDAKLVLAMAHHQLGDRDRGREIYRETVDELDNKKTYSDWYKMEFRVVRAEADEMFIMSSL